MIRTVPLTPWSKILVEYEDGLKGTTVVKKSKGNARTNNMKGQRKEKPALPKKDRSIGTDGSVYHKGSNVRDC
jgi:hypothetical protein